MNKKLEELEKLFSDLSDVTPEKMETLVGESIKAFEGILSKIHSEDEKEKKEGLELAEKLRGTLEKQAYKALDAAKMSAAELEEFTNNPENFNDEEWRALERAKTDIEAYQKDIMKREPTMNTSDDNGASSKDKKKKRKSATPWVIG